MSNKYIRQFGNIFDWLNYSETDLATDLPSYSRNSTRPRAQFNGVESKAQAYNLLKGGYPEGLEKMKEILRKIHAIIRIESPQEVFVSSVEGACPNIEAYLEGQPEDMFALQTEEQVAQPTELRVQLETCVSAWVSPYQLTMVGAAVFAAVESLRAQGCATTIYLTHTVRSRAGNYWQSAVPIGPSCDLDTLSFLLTHPAVLRVIVFSMMEHEEDPIRSEFSFDGGNHSYPATVKNDDCRIIVQAMKLATQFQNDAGEADINKAAAIVQNLVDTKFESYAVPEGEEEKNEFLPWL